MAGLYIHIPFCESRCIYCGFFSTTSLAMRDEYIDALCHEMELRPISTALGGEEDIKTIYLGGGTPSQLSGEQLSRLFLHIESYLNDGQRAKGEVFKGLRGNPELEITMECNPDDVTEDFCESLGTLPINRISMGAQTFSNERLRFLHRRHDAKEVRQAVERIRAIGIHNISLDLMFGFPHETLADWQRDIDEALALGVEHISAYSLMYEEGTALHRLLERGKIEEIDEELSRQMYEMLIDKLTSAGYEHYEISNFARPGFRSRHNSSYWHEVPYIGIGAAAHSYYRDTKSPAANDFLVKRSWNIDNIHAYIDSIRQDRLPSEHEILDKDTRYNDLIATALRTSDGIDLMKMKEEFGESAYHRLMAEADRHIQQGLMKIEHRHLSLTRTGLYISDDIMSDFMIVS